MRQLALLVAMFCLLVCSANPLLAQSATGAITGTVKDSTGAVVTNAPVTVSSQLTGAARNTTTSEAGV